MLGLLLYEALELLYYTGMLAGKGLYAIYAMVYGSAPDPEDAGDAAKLARLEERIRELERRVEGAGSGGGNEANAS